MINHVYVLWNNNDDGKPVVWYVGRTNDCERRLAEHKRYAKRGTELKYHKIRELDQAGVPWYLDVVASYDASDEHSEYEQFWCKKFSHYPLTNMKDGDKWVLESDIAVDPKTLGLPDKIKRKTNANAIKKSNKRFAEHITAVDRLKAPW